MNILLVKLGISSTYKNLFSAMVRNVPPAVTFAAFRLALSANLWKGYGKSSLYRHHSRIYWQLQLTDMSHAVPNRVLQMINGNGIF